MVCKTIQPGFGKFYAYVVRKMRYGADTINRVNLIKIAMKNMRYKMARTIITVGGMSVGIAAIVFLVSLGYGMQRLVISRVARLDEMRQADVKAHPGSNVKINDQTIATIKEITDVGDVLPLIASVAKIDFKGSSTDTAVFGVTRDYLASSAIQPYKGKIFDSNDISKGGSDYEYNILDLDSAEESSSSTATESTEEGSQTNDTDTSAVKGASTRRVVSYASYGEKYNDVELEVYPNVWVRVRAGPRTDADIIGYTKRVAGNYSGEEVFGGVYIADDVGRTSVINESGYEYGLWVKTTVPLWEKVDGEYIPITDEELQVHKEGYVAELGMDITRINKGVAGDVLGISDGNVLQANDAVPGTPSAGESLELDIEALKAELGDEALIEELGLNDLAVEAGDAAQDIETRSVSSDGDRAAIVSKALLKVLNIEESKAIGQEFSVVFTITGDLLENPEEKIVSEPTIYKISGIISDESAPYFYAPFIELRSLGVNNYTQLKVVTRNRDSLSAVRQKVESLGYSTSSVVDTVDQINQLFNTLRIVLAVIGGVALSVAALGMFNTLTVSLLERTREIGLMKAMGMRSFEIKELFLTESMIMGLFGGFGGILVGFLAGKLISVLLSIISLSRGVGTIDVSHIPITFILLIVFLSLIVGLITGIYPARRATKISALNALRYE